MYKHVQYTFTYLHTLLHIVRRVCTHTGHAAAQTLPLMGTSGPANSVLDVPSLAVLHKTLKALDKRSRCFSKVELVATSDTLPANTTLMSTDMKVLS